MKWKEPQAPHISLLGIRLPWHWWVFVVELSRLDSSVGGTKGRIRPSMICKQWRRSLCHPAASDSVKNHAELSGFCWLLRKFSSAPPFSSGCCLLKRDSKITASLSNSKCFFKREIILVYFLSVFNDFYIFSIKSGAEYCNFSCFSSKNLVSD